MTKILVIGATSLLIEALRQRHDVEIVEHQPGITGRTFDQVIMDEIPEPTKLSLREDSDRQYGKKYRRSLRR